jgi:hypothetical protein
MKRRNGFLVAVLVLVASLTLALPVAGQTAEAGFDVDCDGASPFGWVPPGEIYDWSVRLWDPTYHTLYIWDGSIYGGADGAPFNFNPFYPYPSNEWPEGIEITSGFDYDSSYFWWSVFTPYGEIKGEGHFLCGDGCTPGFWQGKNNGRTLWDEMPDGDFNPAGGNPYYIDDLFNGFFTPVGSLDGLSMIDLVGTGGKQDVARKAARDLVAAYLNASHTGVDYPFSTTELQAMWDAAVADGTFAQLHTWLDMANNLGCEIP